MFKPAKEMRDLAFQYHSECYTMARTGLINYIENMANKGHYEISTHYDNLLTYDFIDKVTEELRDLGYSVSLQDDYFTIRW